MKYRKIIQNGQKNWTDIFSKEKMQMANRHLKDAYHQWSGKFKSKPQWGITWNLLKWVIIKKTTNIKCWPGHGEPSRTGAAWERNPEHPLENKGRGPQEIKAELTYNPEIPLLGIFPNKTQVLIWKGMCTPGAPQQCLQQPDTEATHVSNRQTMKKTGHVCTMGYCPAVKKNAGLPFATTWTDLKGITLSNTSQTKTYFEWTKQMNKHNKTETLIQGTNRWFPDRWRQEEGDRRWRSGDPNLWF